MTPIEALRAARHLGLEIEPDGEHLSLSARLPPPARLRDALREHKAQILALLRPDESGWTGENWAAFYEERAAILEHEHGLMRLEAERRAREQTEAERARRLGHTCPMPRKPAML